MSTPTTNDCSTAATCMVHPAELAASMRDAMFELFAQYYANAERSVFEADLDEKHWVVLVRDANTHSIHGFSTLMRLETTVAGNRVVGFYSGDTIVDRSAWGQTDLQRAWARAVWDMSQSSPDARVYWLLVSCAFRTYRFLPLFFRTFYPCFREPMPESIWADRTALARLKFGNQFDPTTGIVRFTHPTPVHPGVADLTPERLRDPHVAFYVNASPEYSLGHGLACVARMCAENLTPAALRMLRSST